MRILLVLVCLMLGFSAVAETPSSTWVGHSEEELISTLGKPNQIVKDDSGTQFLFYRVSTNQHMFRNFDIYISKTSDVLADDLCETTFVVDKDGTVSSIHGANCRFRAPASK